MQRAAEIATVDSVPLGTGLANPDLSEQAIADCWDWLSFHRVWGTLTDETLRAIATTLHLIKVEPETLVYEAGQSPAGVYLLKWGSVELFRASSIGKTHLLYHSAGELFGYWPFTSAVPPRYQEWAIAISASEIWFCPQVAFTQLLQEHPSLQGVINQCLNQDLAQVAERVAKEEVRIQGLPRYLAPVPQGQTLIGSSKAAEKLRQQVTTASADLRPVVLQGAAGTGKTIVAGQIHQQSGIQAHPFAELDCAQLPRDESGMLITDALFGRNDTGVMGVLEILERGTLLIDNAHLLPPTDRDRLVECLNTGTFQRNTVQPDQAQSLVQAWVRLIVASPKSLTLGDLSTHRIKLFTLSQRKNDIPQFAQHFLTRFCQQQGRSLLQLDQADLRRLVSYNYPGNLRELAGILQRAVTMTPAGQDVIPESVLWSVQSPKNAFRIDLLNQYPWLRKILLNEWYPKGIWLLVMATFIPVTLMGYLGPQVREASMTLNFFWAWWWPLYLFLFVFVGRIWCAVCPFMITAEWLRTLSLWLFPRKLRPWNTQWLNRWGAWWLFGGFLAIYLWEKLWDLPHTPYLSSWLLLVITAGAVIFSLIYERRLWCRYLCPIGGMNGMFAKLSILELRSTQQVCGSQCSTFGCYKGSPETPVQFADALPNEGQETGGCPLYSHPAQLQDNRDCVLCMTCLKACPHRSVQLNLRFPATDLLENHRGFWAEAALLLLLLGGVFMHHATDILRWFGWENLPLDANHLLISLPIVLALLSIPAVLTYVVQAIARWIDPELPDYLTLIYAYLPLTLAANLAHYVPAALTEAGQILPVMARTFGFNDPGLPVLTWSLDVAQFLQEVTLLSALAFSLYPLVRIAQRPLTSLLPHIVLLVTFTVIFFQFMV